MTYQKYCGSNKKRIGCSFLMSSGGGAKRLRLRFEVFKRDNFTCQYCGRKAPNITLHIDHRYPESKGGEYTANNLITSCSDCNIGKSDLLLEN
jgi:5-methylcytosine-specific restriction endonuclease McrA